MARTLRPEVQPRRPCLVPWAFLKEASLVTKRPSKHAGKGKA
jgi:hypothetical protein